MILVVHGRECQLSTLHRMSMLSMMRKAADHWHNDGSHGLLAHEELSCFSGTMRPAHSFLFYYESWTAIAANQGTSNGEAYTSWSTKDRKKTIHVVRFRIIVEIHVHDGSSWNSISKAITDNRLFLAKHYYQKSLDIYFKVLYFGVVTKAQFSCCPGSFDKYQACCSPPSTFRTGQQLSCVSHATQHSTWSYQYKRRTMERVEDVVIWYSASSSWSSLVTDVVRD